MTKGERREAKRIKNRRMRVNGAGLRRTNEIIYEKSKGNGKSALSNADFRAILNGRK